jgi:CMP/dCMP kinase
MSRIVSVDGPSASGKSTVARIVARELKWSYVDSGSLYRGVTWFALSRGIDCRDAAAIEKLAADMKMEFHVQDGAVRFRVEGADPGEEIRAQRINENVSHVAAVPCVRRSVVAWLRGMTKLGNLVMEGRDIGTAVFPDAEFKFYLDASEEERARRRHAEMTEQGKPVTLDQVGGSLKRRDAIDSTRKMDPLRPAADAVRIDSTAMGRDAVAAFILKSIRGARI